MLIKLIIIVIITKNIFKVDCIVDKKISKKKGEN